LRDFLNLDLFRAVDKARKILGLGEDATREEIQKVYKELMKKYHPDKAGNKRKYLEKSKQINWAYSVIVSYCADYRFSFCREDVEKVDPAIRLNRQFSDDWLMK
jgi:hypothetical protein